MIQFSHWWKKSWEITKLKNNNKIPSSKMMAKYNNNSNRILSNNKIKRDKNL